MGSHGDRPLRESVRVAGTGRAWLACLACLLGLSVSTRSLAERELVLGRLSDDPSAHVARTEAMLDYVLQDLAQIGVSSGRVLMARDANQMSSYLRQGEVDWVGDTAAVAVQLMERAGAQPIAIGTKGGSDQYHAVMFARRDSGITSIADLAGRTIAFQNASSTSAYYLPAAMLLDAGMTLTVLASPLDRPRSDLIGYAFSRTEVNSAVWVHKRVVDAAAVSDQDWNDPRQVPDSFKQDLQIFATSENVPRSLELVRHDLDADIRERLLARLLSAHDDAAGRQALASYFGVQRFDLPSAESIELMRDFSERMRRVREEVE